MSDLRSRPPSRCSLAGHEPHVNPHPDEAAIHAIDRPHRSLWTYYWLNCLVVPPALPITLTYCWFRYHSMRYKFTDEGISMSWGILFRRQIIINYARIQDIHLRSNIVERWLGLARVLVQTASGSSGAEMTLEGLQEFEAVRDFLYSKMRGVKDHGQLPAVPAPAGPVPVLSSGTGGGAPRSRPRTARNPSGASGPRTRREGSRPWLTGSAVRSSCTVLKVPPDPQPPFGDRRVRSASSAPAKTISTSAPRLRLDRPDRRRRRHHFSGSSSSSRWRTQRRLVQECGDTRSKPRPEQAPSRQPLRSTRGLPATPAESHRRCSRQKTQAGQGFDGCAGLSRIFIELAMCAAALGLSGARGCSRSSASCSFSSSCPLTYAIRRLDVELHWYIVTDRSLRIRTGLVRLQETTMSFANLQQVEVKQGPLQRLLGLADVHVQSAGGGSDQPGRPDRRTRCTPGFFTASATRTKSATSSSSACGGSGRPASAIPMTTITIPPPRRRPPRMPPPATLSPLRANS